jgi:Fanconi-associated nuclease 1
VIYHYNLQKRIKKLEKNLKVSKREQHEFSHVSLIKATEREVIGVRIQKEYGAPRKPKRGEERLRSSRTIWVDEREGGGECSVEAMCLSWYRGEGWKGYHAEGGIIRTLFAYLFYDVLFLYIPNVFQTPYQTCPLDLHTDAFYAARASEISHRLVDIGNGDAEQLIREVDKRERGDKTCIIGLSWDFGLEDLVEIANCFRGPALATICTVIAQDYRQRASGIPDLFLWNPEKREVMFSEVKSENDRLSDTQRLWIHVLTSSGVRVELCKAVAREVRIVKV